MVYVVDDISSGQRSSDNGRHDKSVLVNMLIVKRKELVSLLSNVSSTLTAYKDRVRVSTFYPSIVVSVTPLLISQKPSVAIKRCAFPAFHFGGLICWMAVAPPSPVVVSTKSLRITMSKAPDYSTRYHAHRRILTEGESHAGA